MCSSMQTPAGRAASPYTAQCSPAWLIPRMLPLIMMSHHAASRSRDAYRTGEVEPSGRMARLTARAAPALHCDVCTRLGLHGGSILGVLRALMGLYGRTFLGRPPFCTSCDASHAPGLPCSYVLLRCNISRLATLWTPTTLRPRAAPASRLPPAQGLHPIEDESPRPYSTPQSMPSLRILEQWTHDRYLPRVLLAIH